MTFITRCRRSRSLFVLVAVAVVSTAFPAAQSASAEPPLTIDMTGRELDFVHPTTVGAMEVGDSHRFVDVITADGVTVDAIVTVTAAVNSRIDEVDEDDEDDDPTPGVYRLDSRPNPALIDFPIIDRYVRSAVELIDEDDPASVTYTIEFVEQVSDSPVTLQNLNMQVYDLDVSQYVEVPGAHMYWLSKESRVTPSLNAGVLRLTGFPQGTAPEAPGYFSYTLGRAEVAYPAVSEVVVTLGFPNAGNLELDFSDAGLPWESFGTNIRRDGVLANDVTVPVDEPELIASASELDTGETAYLVTIGDSSGTVLCMYSGTTRLDCEGTVPDFDSPSLISYDDLFPELGTTMLTFRLYDLVAFGDGSEVDFDTASLDSVSITLLGAVDVPVIPSNPSRRPSNPPVTTVRVAGDDRVATAVAISQQFFTSAPVVYLVLAGADADAVVAAAAAGAAGAPVLYVSSTTVPTSTMNEIARLNPSRVVIIGGTARVAMSAEAAIELQFPHVDVDRIAGADRVETAVTTSKDRWSTSDVVYVVGTNAPADALVAAAHGKPVLFVHRGEVPVETLNEIRRLGASRVVIVGGTVRVATSTEAALAAALPGVTVERVAGPDRFHTARELGVRRLDLGGSTVFLASGSVSADGFVAAAAAHKQGAPLMLTRPDCLPAVTRSAVARRKLVVVGGPDVIASAVMSRVVCIG